MVQWVAGAVINIKLNTQVFKVLFHQRMVLINNCLSGGTFLGCLNRDGRAMFIASTNKHHISLLCF